MVGRSGRRAGASALVVVIFAVLLPMATPAPAVAASSAAGGALAERVRRDVFLAAEGDDGAAAAARDLAVEVPGDATGADGDEVEVGGPVPPGANPRQPDPGTSVLPDPVEQEGEAELITVPARGPPADPEDAEPAAADEVVAKRTERSKTYANGDGSFTTESSIEPIHVEHRGGWIDIDVDLHRGPDGEIENGAAAVDIELAEDGASDQLAEVGLDGGTAVAYGLVGAADVEPVVDGAVATYEEILPGVDLELESVPGGLKETAILASVDAPSELTFTLDLDGLTAELEPTGGVALLDEDGEAVAAIPPGFMEDEAGATSDAVSYALDERGGEQVLVVTPDRTWLDDPARAWPVRVDPTTVDRTPFDDTYVKSGQNIDRSGAVELRAGPEGGVNTAAYMLFWMNIPVNSFISAATLYAHNSYSAGGCAAKPVGVYRVTGSWAGSTMTTWPGASYDSTPIDTQSFAYGGGAGCPSNWASWNVRSLVTNWTKGAWPNYGVSLRVPSQHVGDAGTGKRFTSIEGSAQDAFIRVTWSPWGAQYNPGNDWAGGQQATNNTTGKWPMQIRNVGSTTWVAGSDVKLGTRVYTPSQNGTGTPVAQTRTTLPEDVSPQELVAFNANVPPLPPGNYEVFFEMVKEGDFWFSAEDPYNSRLGVGIQVVNQVPQFTLNAPHSGDEVYTRRPLLIVEGEDPDDYGLIIEYFFRICPGPETPQSFPGAQSGCQSSGWSTDNMWTPPNPLPRWNEGAYWWAFIRDRTGPEPRFAAPVMIIPTPSQSEWAELGQASSSTTDGGVDVRTGSFTSATTDLSVGWGSSTFGITRTYNSAAYLLDGNMGKGWSSILDVKIDTPLASSRPESFTLFREDGRRETWARDTIVSGAGEEVYKGPLGSSETLVWDLTTSRYVWRHADRTEYRFSIAGYLTSIHRPGLPEITVERSNPTSPQALAFEVGTATISIDWSSGKVAAIRTTGPGSDARWRYTYTHSLSSVCDPRPVGERGCHTFEYQTFPTSINGTTNGPLAIARNNGEIYLRLQHETDSQPRVQWRRDGEAHQWDYAYTTYSCPGSGTSTTQCRRSTVTQPNPTGYLYSGSAQPLPLVFDFDRFKRLVKRTNERGLSVTWSYDALGFMYQQIDENGIGRVFWYDVDGHLRATTDTRDGTPGAPIFATTWFEYPTGLKRSDPRWGQPIWSWDPRVSMGERSLFDATWMRYDTSGRLVERRSPATDDAPVGRSEHFSYRPNGSDGAGQLASTTDIAGRVTTFEYIDGRVSASVDPLGVRTEYDYTPEGWVGTTTVISEDHPGGVATTMDYDEAGQLVRIEGPPVTNPVDAVTRQLVIERTFDPGRRLVEETSLGTGTEPDRTTQWTEFDGNGRPTENVDALGNVTTTEWNWRGMRRSVESANGHRVVQMFARSGQVARVLSMDTRQSGHSDLIAAFSYDPAGRIASKVDARGATTNHTYWDDGRPRRTTLLHQRTPSSPVEEVVLLSLSYDLAGNVTHERTRDLTLDKVTTYDMANSVVRVDAGGRYVEYDHRLDGLVESMTEGDATHQDVTEYGYEPLPGLQPAYTAVHRADGVIPYITGFEYDDRGLLRSTSTPKGQTDFEYDVLGRPTRTLRPEITVEGHGVATTTARPEAVVGYDTFGQVIHEQAADGTVATSAYDGLGRLLSRTLPPYSPQPGTSLDATTTYAYDDVDRTRSVTDELRDVTVVEQLDHRGQVLEVEAPPLVSGGASRVTSMQWSTAGDLLATMGPEGAVTTSAYDNAGLVTSSTVEERYGTPGSYTTSYVHDDQLDLTSINRPSSGSHWFTHNVFGEVTSDRVVGAGAPPNIGVVHRLDHRGRVERTEDNLGRATEVTREGTGLVTESRSYQGSTLLRTEQYVYDHGLDLELAITPSPNPGGGPVATTYDHDAQGRLVSMTEPGGITTSYGHDVMGRPVRNTDGRGNATWKTYTPWGDVASVIEPATTAHPAVADRTWTTRWAAPGLMDRETAPGGVVREMAYDTAGNVVSATGTGGDVGASRTFEWDRAGRLVEAANAQGSQVFSWDDRGNLLDSSGVAGTSSMRYDAAGRMTSRSDAGATSTFTYFSNGLLKTATGNQTNATETYAYDAAGQLSSISYPSGTTRSFTYDGFGNPSSDTLATNGTTIASQSFTWGPDGEHLASTTTGPATIAGAGTESYTYDGAGRLATTTRGSSTTSTTWDAAGNRLTQGAITATYDQRNRLMTSGPPGAVETYSWTPRGTVDSTTSSAGTTDYQFDAFDRLVREDGPSGVDQLQWDALDRLATVDGASLSYAAMERDPVAVPGQVYERGPTGALRAFEPTGGTARFLRSNQRGDVGATFVPGATSVATSRAFEPFGTTTSTGSPQPAAGFQGDWTSSSGLVHMDARFYDPSSGSFLSRDSWDLTPGTSAGTNRYSYGSGNPVTMTDPTGHCSIHIGGGGGGFLGRTIGGGCWGGGGDDDGPSTWPSWMNWLFGIGAQCLGFGCGGSSSTDSGSDSPGGGGVSSTVNHRPTRPKPPAKPPRPSWTTVRPTRPAPSGHLTPLASVSGPTVEGSWTLLVDPTQVPLTGYMPQAATTPLAIQTDSIDDESICDTDGTPLPLVGFHAFACAALEWALNVPQVPGTVGYDLASWLRGEMAPGTEPDGLCDALGNMLCAVFRNPGDLPGAMLGGLWDTVYDIARCQFGFIWTILGGLSELRGNAESCGRGAFEVLLAVIGAGVVKRLTPGIPVAAITPRAMKNLLRIRKDTLRYMHGISRNRNIATAHYSIDGVERDLYGVSGAASSRPGGVKMPDERRYQETHGVVNDRHFESEHKVFEAIAEDLGPPSDSVRGSIDIYTERPACDSCLQVMEQFQQDYPNVTINIYEGE